MVTSVCPTHRTMQQIAHPHLGWGSEDSAHVGAIGLALEPLAW